MSSDETSSPAASVPAALDVKVFAPARDHSRSIAFYEALGWRCNWRVEGLAEIELAGVRLYLQDFYAREWAENFMIYVDVEDAHAWYERARQVVESGEFDGTRVAAPELAPHGDVVTRVWDPCGVLLHFAQPGPGAAAADGSTGGEDARPSLGGVVVALVAAAIALSAAALPLPASAQVISAYRLGPSEIPAPVDRVEHAGLQARLQAGSLPEGEALTSLPDPIARLVEGTRAILEGRLGEADRILAPLSGSDGGVANVATAFVAQLRYERGDYDGLAALLGETPLLTRALAAGPGEQFTPVTGTVPAGADVVELGERGHIGLAARSGDWQGTFWFDTGAGLTVVSDTLAARLGVQILAEDPVSLSTSTELESEARIGVLPELEVGAVRLENHRVAVVPSAALRMADSERDWGTLHAILGWPALRRMRLTVDVPGRTFAAELADEPASDPALPTQPNLTWMGYPLLRLTAADGQQLLFGIDTGSWNTSLTTKGRHALGLAVARRETVDVTGVGGSQRVETDFVDGVTLVISGVRYDLDDVAVEEHSGSDEVTFFRVDGVLGADVLRPSRLTLDFAARRFELAVPTPYHRPEGAPDVE